MTQEAAIWQFFNSFGMPGYPNSAVPEDAVYPYITYGLVIGGAMDYETNVAATVWYRTEGEAVLNEKAREIHDAVGFGGLMLHCDNGAVWVKRGSPWAQSIASDRDEKVKGRLINFDIEYLTTE